MFVVVTALLIPYTFGLVGDLWPNMEVGVPSQVEDNEYQHLIRILNEVFGS